MRVLFCYIFQCISTLAFVKNEPEVLDSPIWVMVINIGKLRVQPHFQAETHKIKKQLERYANVTNIGKLRVQPHFQVKTLKQRPIE